jgi:hypothetical protein
LVIDPAHPTNPATKATMIAIATVLIRFFFIFVLLGFVWLINPAACTAFRPLLDVNKDALAYHAGRLTA